MKWFKQMGKALIVAFSIYSKIPMPRFNWESDDMKYHLCFFPWVGAAIGGLQYAWFVICRSRDVGSLAFVTVAMAIPVLITGGFHLDGFMDTCDALHSYQDREKKLEILKDPHIGAFAVICLALYLLLTAGALALIREGAAAGARILGEDGRGIAAICLGFFLSRALSGISVVTMPGAKKKGMLQTFSDTAEKKTVLTVLIAEVTLCAGAMIVISPAAGALAILAAGVAYGYYVYESKKQFGGITGDLAGYFVSLAELLILTFMGGAVLLFG